jgi:hypothetical protein
LAAAGQEISRTPVVRLNANCVSHCELICKIILITLSAWGCLEKGDTTVLIKAILGLSTAIALAAVSVAPAVAQTKYRTAKQTRSAIPPPAIGWRGDGRAHSNNPRFDVYVDGRYAGSDPDPIIRSRLASDPPWNDNNN